MSRHLPVVVSIFAACFFSFSGSANAVDIRITGQVGSSACEVDSDLAYQTVQLGTVPRYQLSAPNTGTDWKVFELKVFNCPDVLQKAKVAFAGQAAGSDNSLYLSTGSAQSVAVQLAENINKNNILASGDSLETAIDPVTHGATFDLAARMYSELGSATAGEVTSFVEVGFSYE